MHKSETIQKGSVSLDMTRSAPCHALGKPAPPSSPSPPPSPSPIPLESGCRIIWWLYLCGHVGGDDERLAGDGAVVMVSQR